MAAPIIGVTTYRLLNPSGLKVQGATEAYIRTATGLDYAEAGPIRGVRSGGGSETMTYSVMFPSQQ